MNAVVRIVLTLHLLIVCTSNALPVNKCKSLDSVKSYATDEDQAKAAQALFYRFLGNRSDEIQAIIDSSFKQEPEYVMVSSRLHYYFSIDCLC